MSDNPFAYYDDQRDAVILRLESGTEIAVMDPAEAESLGRELLAAADKRDTGYEEFLAQERGEEPHYPRTCILTGSPTEDPEDCTTHDHEDDSAEGHLLAAMEADTDEAAEAHLLAATEAPADEAERA